MLQSVRKVLLLFVLPLTSINTVERLTHVSKDIFSFYNED